jgi:hypothetical protein
MNRQAQHVFVRVQAAWDKLTVAIQKMYQSSGIRPISAHDVFKWVSDTADDEVCFDVGPVVFNVPERVGKRGSMLYVAVKGWLSFGGGDLRATPLKTRSFGTEIGYFRVKGTNLEHVYGVHYDLDERLPGHPVFHAQLTPQMEMVPKILELFDLQNDVENLFDPKLRHIRIPTAQMDVFSTIIQICADHLVYDGAGDTVHAAFAEMRSLNDFFVGAAHRMPYLNLLPATGCYRSAHWYGNYPPRA